MSEQLVECFRDLPDYLGWHMLLSVSALAVGLAISVPLGIAVSRRPRVAELTQGVAGVIQTVPSLALLVLMVPLLGGRTGFWPAFVALTLYSILPILANTVIGLRGVDPVLIEVGRGLGMSDRELLRLVQLPLAAPVIIGGVRTATVLVVGTATLVTPVGGTSLGNYIFGGLETSDYVATVFGCVLAAVLAVVMDQLVRLFELAAQRRDRRLAWIGAAGLLLLLGVGLYGPISKLFAPSPQYIAGAPFTEQHILSEVMKQKLWSAGLTVNQRKGMAEGVQFLALRGNQIDCCINYTGNIWAVLMKQKASAQRQTIDDEVSRFLRERYGVVCLGKLGFENAYALAMSPKRAEELLGSDRRQWTVSRLSAQARRLPVSVSGDLQFFRRLEWRQLRDRYELRFRAKHEADPTLMYGAVRDGEVDVIVAYTSDGRIEKYGLVLLKDDLGVLPSYDAILLVSGKAAAKPGLIEALKPLVKDGGAINNAAMQEANRQVDVEGKSPRRVARDLLEAIAARQQESDLMVDEAARQVQQRVGEIYRSESRRVFATLVKVLGDFELAEEANHEAFAAALEHWSRDGVPSNPRAWLVSAGRFKAIDAIRRRKRFDASLGEVARRLAEAATPKEVNDDEEAEDDRLRLIFTCCHPALAPETQVALTLREVCGLKTEEIASAFLSAPSTIAQRIVRGKAKIRDAQIPYQVPALADLPERLDSVLAVIYLVFNEGYSASSGESLTRPTLSEEAIRLGRLLVELMPDAEALGLLALMLLQESRRPARTSLTGDLILLEDQDRSLWSRQQIAEGTAFAGRALSSQRIGVYTIQAAIAALHSAAPSASATDWAQVVAWYDVLARAEPSPIVELNRAVAVAMRDGPLAGLELIDAILARGDLAEYHLAHAARADLCRRLGRTADARESYERAAAQAKQDPEGRFLQRRLRELG